MGIYVSGVLCQDVVKEDGTGLYCLIRLADRLSVVLPAGAVPGSFPLQQATTHALIFYRSDAPEQFSSSVRIVDPSGAGPAPRVDRITTGGGTVGHLSHINLVFDAWRAGLWWIEVLVNGELKLRIPFEITHTQADSSHPEGPSPTPA